MTSSQASSNLFGSDQDEFEEALMAIDLDTPSRPAVSHSAAGSPTPPANANSRKRKFSQTEDAEGQEDSADIDPHAMATMRQKDDRTDIYGASSFGDYGKYMSRKRAKLQIQNEDMTITKSQIFAGIGIYINGWTEPSVQVLREMIVEHGGKFHAYLTHKGLVTHIVAMNVTPAKVKEYQNMKVVRPNWITESVDAGILLPWREFKLEMEARLDVGQGRRIPQATLPVSQVVKSQSQIKGKETLRPDGTSAGRKVIDQGIQLEKEEGKETSAALLVESPSHGIRDPIYMTDPVTFEQAARIPSYALNKSNVAAQRLMALPGWKEEHTASSGTKFINSYYQNSRLHHLSMWKAELKDLVAKAQERFENEQEGMQMNQEGRALGPQMGHGVSMKGAELLKTWEASSPGKKGKGPATNIVERVYMHCDFDCFFVSVGLLDRPELRGKPVVVCHSQGTGEGVASTSEVASSSYEARASGIRNGMSLGQARQLCAEVTTLPYEFEKYKEISLKFYTVLLSYADELQAVSVDEALLDVSHTVANLKVQALSQDPDDHLKDFSKLLAEQIRERMLAITGCSVSIGIGENLLLARIASRRAKPAGSYHLLTVDAPGFLAPLPLDMIWGVGYSNKKKAQEKLGIENIGDLSNIAKGNLVKVFGPAMGDKLWKTARGLDDSKLQPDQKRKSVSAEINFGIRFQNDDEAEHFMRKLGKEVSDRLQALSMKGRHLTLKIMKRHPEAPVEAPKFMGHGICETFSKSTSIGEPDSAKGRKEILATNNADILGETAWKLLLDFKFDSKELRGLGLQVTKLQGQGDEGSAPAEKELEGGQRRLVFNAEVKLPAKAAATEPLAVELHKDFHPTEDTLDLEALDALPEDIRTEIMAQLKINGVGASTSNSHLPQESVDETNALGSPTLAGVDEVLEIHDTVSGDLDAGSLAAPIVVDSNIATASKSSRATSISVSSKDVAHITRQLRPKHKAVVTTPINTGAQANHAIFSRGGRASDASHEELKELGLDPDVFYALPEDLQKEQLKLERGKLKTASASKRIGFGDAFERLSKSPAPPPITAKMKANYPEKIPLGVNRGRSAKSVEAKGKQTITELGDIQAYVKRWVSVSHAAGLGPSKVDVDGLKTWFVKCMSQEGTGSGMEKAMVILRWWRELLRKFWSEDEPHGMIEADKKGTMGAGKAWWIAFGECKSAIDGISKTKFGGKMSLK